MPAWLDALDGDDFEKAFRLFQQQEAYDEDYLDTIVGACIHHMVECTSHAEAAATCLLALHEKVTYWTPFVAAYAAISVIESRVTKKVDALRLVATCKLCKLDERWNEALARVLDDSSTTVDALVVALEIVERLEDDDALTMSALALASNHADPEIRHAATRVVENSDSRRTSLSMLLLTRMELFCRDWMRLGRESLRIMRAVFRACCGEIVFEKESGILEVVCDLGGCYETWASIISCLSSSPQWPELAERYCRTLIAPFEREDIDETGLSAAAELASKLAVVANARPRPFAQCWEALHLHLSRARTIELLDALVVPIEYCDEECFEDVKRDSLLRLIIAAASEEYSSSSSETAWRKFIARKDTSVSFLVDFAFAHPFLLPSLLESGEGAANASFKTALETTCCDEKILVSIGAALVNNMSPNDVISLLNWSVSQDQVRLREPENELRVRSVISIVWRAAALASSSPLLSAWPLLETISSPGCDSIVLFDEATRHSQRMLRADTIGEVAEAAAGRISGALKTSQRLVVELILQKAHSLSLDAPTRRRIFASLVRKYIEGADEVDWPLLRRLIGSHDDDDLETVATIARSLVVAASAAFAARESSEHVIARELGRNVLRALCVADAAEDLAPSIVHDATAFLFAVVESAGEDVCIWARRAAARLDELCKLQHSPSTSSLYPDLAELLSHRVARLSTNGPVQRQNETSPLPPKKRKLLLSPSEKYASPARAPAEGEQGDNSASRSPMTAVKWAAAYTPTMDSTSSSQTQLLFPRSLSQ